MDQTGVQQPIVDPGRRGDRKSPTEDRSVADRDHQMASWAGITGTFNTDLDAWKAPQLLDRRRLVEKFTPEHAGTCSRIDDGHVEAEPDDIEKVPGFRDTHRGLPRSRMSSNGPDYPGVDRLHSAGRESIDRLLHASWVQAEVSTEIVAGARREEAEHEVIAPLGLQHGISDMAPCAVAPRCHDAIEAGVDGLPSQKPLIAAAPRALVLEIDTGPGEQGDVVLPQPRPPAPTRGRVEDDEETTAQIDSISSKVCTPARYHSSRNG